MNSFPKHLGKLFFFIFIPFEILFISLVKIRILFYTKLLKRENTSENPIVVSIGNLSMGGTGKTPTCLALYSILQKKYKTAIFLRGYKSKGEGLSDEEQVYKSYISSDHVFVNPLRLESWRKAKSLSYQVALLDDGFQHLKIDRQLDVVVIDALKPPHKSACIPRGMLREPMSSLKRAHWIVFTRCEQVSKEYLHSLIDILKRRFVHLEYFFAYSKFSVQIMKKNNDESLDLKKSFIFSGIGHPENFEKSVLNQGIELMGKKFYSDHYHYSQKDISLIEEKALSANATYILCTEKDWVKIKSFEFSLPIAVLKMEFSIEGETGKPIENFLIEKINSLYTMQSN